MSLRDDADYIIKKTLEQVLPDKAVYKAIQNKKFESNNIYTVAIGKAAWQMTKAASTILKDKFKKGIIITKYHHSKGKIPNTVIYEAGHPIPDSNSFNATKEVIKFVSNLDENDIILFLVSGGGSALFELPLIEEKELQYITKQLLECGADITEINTIRKRLSQVKGGRFAKICQANQVFSIVISDILGDPLDLIASGPMIADETTYEQALNIINKYKINLSKTALNALKKETNGEVSNVETIVTGSVKELCIEAQKICNQLGYETFILTDQLNCEAKEAGKFLSSIAKTWQTSNKSIAFLAGGETVVHITGDGLGGRNQEIALASAIGLKDCIDTCIFSIGSDGTDGPTNAAGGFVDNTTYNKLVKNRIDVFKELSNNNSYYCLDKINGLIKTGPTGTNVNDISIILIKR